MAGEEFTGVELDGMLYPEHERVMIATHKGPMLAKFASNCPSIEVRHDVHKIAGNGEDLDFLHGEQRMKLDWFPTSEATLYVHAMSGRGDQGVVGWTAYSSTSEWLTQLGLSESDHRTVDRLLDMVSAGEEYTMLFMKAVLIMRTICVAYSVSIGKFCCCEMPTSVKGDMKTKLGQLRRSSCVIDLDVLNKTERLVALLSSKQYPSVAYKVGDGDVCSVYSCISLPECDVTFFGGDVELMKKIMPTPVMWWEGVVGLACKLGAVKDLVKAFRATRGWGSFAAALGKLGVSEYDLQIECPETRGCRSVLMGCDLSKIDTVVELSNLACSLGELVVDWGCGVEMINMFFHLSDEFGLSNKELYVNANSVRDSLLREAGFFDYGEGNTLYQEWKKRFQTEITFLGNTSLMDLIRVVSDKMMDSVGPSGNECMKMLREVKNTGFTAYFDPLWYVNATSMIGEEVVLDPWGVASKKKSEVSRLRDWMDIYGLSDDVLMMSGYNTLWKSVVELLSDTSMIKIEEAHGTYVEVWREVNWLTEYEPRVGSEEMEKDRLVFVKTYLGFDLKRENEPAAEEISAEAVATETATQVRGALISNLPRTEESDGEKTPGEQLAVDTTTKLHIC